MSKKLLVTPEYYLGLQEWYLNVIECPNCESNIPADSKYCGYCGSELKLSQSIVNKNKSLI